MHHYGARDRLPARIERDGPLFVNCGWERGFTTLARWHTEGVDLRKCALALVTFLVAVAPYGALAQTSVGERILVRAVDALRSDPVFVDPQAASSMSDREADSIRDAIAEANVGAIYVAVLPEEARLEAGGTTGAVLQEIGNTLERNGTYIVIVGRELRAGSSEFEEGVVPSLADEAVQDNQGGSPAGLVLSLIERLGSADEGGSGGGSGGGGGSFLPFLFVGGGALFLVSSMRRKKRRREEEKAQLEEVREVALEDLVELGDDLRALDLDVEMPGADPRAKEDYVTALGCYERATSQLDKAQRPQDLAPVTEILEEGRYAMASARARLEGKEPPPRNPPCFFDPRHGPSERDVEWSLPGSTPRMVPACAADAARVEAGAEPNARQIVVQGQSMPYWNAPYYYGPWAGGWFGGMGGGLFQGMLLGSMLGHGMGFGGFGGYGGHGSDSGSGGDGDGGGWGGGDFGGGGGFGGGDFGGGGGDFGGGDF